MSNRRPERSGWCFALWKTARALTWQFAPIKGVWSLLSGWFAAAALLAPLASEAQLAVSDGGCASYSFPIKVPPDVEVITPDLGACAHGAPQRAPRPGAVDRPCGHLAG